MNKKDKKRRLWIIAILAVLVLLILLTLVFFLPGRVRARFSRPLVLIHNPLNRQVISLEDSVLVHATARNERGITRLELWVDGEIVDRREPAGGQAVNPFVLNANWQPATPGEHVLVVRAFSRDNVEGQSSIVVEVIPAAAADSHLVQEGDTLESIAEDYGTTPEEIEDLNPGLDGEEPAPGDELDIPGGGEGGDDETVEEPEDGDAGGDGVGEEEEEEDPPEPHADPPGGMELGDWLFGVDWGSLFDLFDDTPSRLVVEILSFSTTNTYEDVHCYVSLADNPWFVLWDALNLSTGLMTSLEWPGDEPLRLDSTCEGIAAGGLASDDLGEIHLNIPPSEWDNVIRTAESSGGESRHQVEYRVGYEEARDANLDPDMTPPTNLYLDPMRYALRWEYHPRPEEAPIDGFRVYLNNTLQWIEPADARLSDLPPEWFRPPCGEVYTFTVTAFRGSGLDAPESAPTDPPAVIEAEDNCEKEFMVTFLSLRTYDLPGDGRYEDRTGDLGPVHGYFFSNSDRETFDTGSLAYGGSLGTATGINANTLYSLETFAAAETRSWSGYPVTYADVPEEDLLTVGFHIMDEDRGHCSYEGDPDCDDLLCEAQAEHFNGPTAELDRTREYTLRSDNGRCEITYTIGLAPGSSVGSADTEYPPLPWLEIEQVRYDDEANQYQIQIRNTGTATWPYRNLTIGMVTREGDSIGTYDFEEFGLEPDDSTTLTVADPGMHAPLELCPFLDPHDQVTELYEALGTRRHVPHCAPLPDLVISEVEYLSGGGGRLRVTYRNQGEGVLVDRVVGLTTTLADGSPAYLAGSWPGVHLEPGESTFRELTGVTEGIYEQLQDGYRVTVDPDGIITESSEDNNDYEVPATVTIRFIPEHIFSGRAAENLFQCRAEAYFQFMIGHGHSLDDVEWVSTRYPESGEVIYQVDNPLWCHGGMPGPWIPGEAYHLDLTVPQDENVYLKIRGWERDGSTNRDSLGEIFVVYTPEDRYGEGSSGIEMEDGGWDHWVWSSEGSCNDARPYGTPRFQARWRIEIIE